MYSFIEYYLFILSLALGLKNNRSKIKIVIIRPKPNTDSRIVELTAPSQMGKNLPAMQET